MVLMRSTVTKLDFILWINMGENLGGYYYVVSRRFNKGKDRRGL